MLNYQIHTVETVPEKSKPLLELFIHAVGFVPNLAAPFARGRTSPVCLTVSRLEANAAKLAAGLASTCF
jgi:hypothetical protein